MDNGAGSTITNIAYNGLTNPSATQASISNLQTGLIYKFNVISHD